MFGVHHPGYTMVRKDKGDITNHSNYNFCRRSQSSDLGGIKVNLFRTYLISTTGEVLCI